MLNRPLLLDKGPDGTTEKYLARKNNDLMIKVLKGVRKMRLPKNPSLLEIRAKIRSARFQMKVLDKAIEALAAFERIQASEPMTPTYPTSFDAGNGRGGTVFSSLRE